jgi:hypothetical protein
MFSTAGYRKNLKRTLLPELLFPTCSPIMILQGYLCEFSLGPEVATLFGREIGQSNGDILLTGVKPARIKVG